MRRLLSLLLLPLLGACISVPADAPRTVAEVDLQRYLGTWHEVARYPNRFEDGSGLRCVDVTAEYALRGDGQIAVTNSCRNAAKGGEARVAHGRAYVVDGSNGARLRVTFFWPFYGDYWVIALDPDYRWSVVGDPRRAYFWILSRSPQMAPADYDAAIAAAQAQGFDPARVHRTPQGWRAGQAGG